MSLTGSIVIQSAILEGASKDAQSPSFTLLPSFLTLSHRYPVTNFAKGWRHLHEFQVWPAGGATCHNQLLAFTNLLGFWFLVLGTLFRVRENTMTLLMSPWPVRMVNNLRLTTSSPFFQNLLKKNIHAHPLIYIRGLKSEDLEAIIDFLYFVIVIVFAFNIFLLLVRSCILITLVQCLKGQKSPRSLFECVL